MKTETESLVLNEPRRTVMVKIGDRVSDMDGYSGNFIIEEIRDDGWIWSSGMNVPYNMHKEKNFINSINTWKI